MKSTRLFRFSCSVSTSSSSFSTSRLMTKQLDDIERIVNKKKRKKQVNLKKQNVFSTRIWHRCLLWVCRASPLRKHSRWRRNGQILRLNTVLKRNSIEINVYANRFLFAEVTWIWNERRISEPTRLIFSSPDAQSCQFCLSTSRANCPTTPQALMSFESQTEFIYGQIWTNKTN
jgi:hypothetical protein